MGLLTTVPAVRAVARALAPGSVPVVVDPGFVPRSGVRHLRSTVVDAVVRDLLPAAALVTLNLLEASALAGFAIRARPTKVAARQIQALGPPPSWSPEDAQRARPSSTGSSTARTWHRFRAPGPTLPRLRRRKPSSRQPSPPWLARGRTPSGCRLPCNRLRPQALAAGWPPSP
ncbi:MAG: bifunctional hydroxymethylpyrimidine kinase/phosphomethylpyrimidine kinase [Holophagales bacterium]|nr:bifunctional hydroxymethylpyrimidine kinase/phosphomethylpyrimidine kinase [Holophagales bacterium]